MTLVDNADFMDCFPTEATKVTYPLSALKTGFVYLFATESCTNMAPIPSDVKETKLCKFTTEQLKELFNITISSLESVLDFIDKNDLTHDNINRMEYITFSIGYMIFNKNRLSTDIVFTS